MDLRSIINNEAGDSSNIKQATLVTPVSTKTADSFQDYGHIIHDSHVKHTSQDYGVQRTSIPPSTYQQNYQNRRPTILPIQVPHPDDLESPRRSFSANSPYQVTPSSITHQLPFPLAQHTPQSPSQSYQYTVAVQHKDASQHSNPHNIPHQDTCSQSSPLPQSPVSTPGAAQPKFQHQRSQSSIPISTSTSFQNLSKYSNKYSQDLFTSGGNIPSLHSQQPQSPAQRAKSSTPFCHSLTQLLPCENISQSTSLSQQKILSGSQIQHLQVSRVHSTSDFTPQQSKKSSDCENQKTISSKHNSRPRSKSSDRSSSPPSLQETDFSLKLERDKTDNQRPTMDNELCGSVKVPIARHVDDNLFSDESSSNTATDSQTPTSAHQPPKKRIRYTEPPIWARSIKTHRNTILANQESYRVKENDSVASHSRANVNGSMPDTHYRVTVADSHPSLSLENWEESITGKKPTEHITKVVADFLYLHVVSRNDLGELSGKGVQIEIEAKLGELIDRDTNMRYILPVRSECVLAENLRIAFKSSMTEQHHQRMNDFLNDMFKRTHPSNPNAKSRVKIDYLHRREIDKFYELPKPMQEALPSAIKSQMPPHHTAKVRVTYDQKTGKVLAKIIKVRVVNLDIYSGLHGAPDCRISINLEMPYNNDLNELLVAGKCSNQSPDRNKDRLSYSQSYYQIDLTQVTQNVLNNNTTRLEKEHELEIELSTNAVMDHGRRAASGQPNEYLPLVEGFLNNVRVLSRTVAEVR